MGVPWSLPWGIDQTLQLGVVALVNKCRDEVITVLLNPRQRAKVGDYRVTFKRVNTYRIPIVGSPSGNWAQSGSPKFAEV